MSEFKDSEFMTAKEKGLVLAQWRRFVERGFNFEHFSDRIYKHLTLHASFIAHFDRRAIAINGGQTRHFCEEMGI